MKFKKLNRKEYLAVMASFVLVVAVSAGLSVAVKDNPQKITEVPQNNPVAEVPVEESYAVDSNQNAPAKTDQVTEVKKPQFVQQDTVANEPATEPIKTVEESSDVDEYDEVTAMANEVTLAWPVKGEIALDFSTDKMVFDPTLEQYRTNDTVCILADKGTAVKAACDGTVSKVFTDNEKGVTVVIDHADGWSTTYSQLNENVAVKEGESVKKGQKIGQVGAPTVLSSALGDHLEFKVCQGDFPIDPKVAIAE